MASLLATPMSNSPFDHYPQSGRELLGRPKNTANCRYGYGLELQRLTGQQACVYCGISLVDEYHRWLLLSVDHVVPKREALRLGIPVILFEDFINLVLCCSGCNGFGNRYKVGQSPNLTWELGDFLNLRDVVYAERTHLIAARRAAEQQFWASKPWEKA